MDLSDYYTLIQASSDHSFVVIPLVNVPHVEQSYFSIDPVNWPTSEIEFRDADWSGFHSGLVKFIGTQDDANHEMLIIANTVQQQLDQLKWEFHQMKKEIDELKFFKRQVDYLLPKVALVDPDTYSVTGRNNFRVSSIDLSIAMGQKEDLSGFAYLARMVFKRNLQGQMWSSFSSRETDDLEDLMGYFLTMKIDYEDKHHD